MYAYTGVDFLPMYVVCLHCYCIHNIVHFMNVIVHVHSRDEAESAKALLAGGADPNITDQLGRTPLILAAYRKSNRTVDALVDCSRTNLDAQVG